MVWRIFTLVCVGPVQYGGLTRFPCLASGLQSGHFKGAELGNLGSKTSSARWKRYSEQEIVVNLAPGTSSLALFQAELSFS